MKAIVTGAHGMLGTDLMHILRLQYDVFGCDLDNCDILDDKQVEQVVSAYRPDVIIHAAAYTNVDQAETDKDLAMQVNATGTMHVAAAAQKYQAKFVYLSTDYVFDGTKTTLYTEEDLPHPLGVYAESKVCGERHVQQMFAHVNQNAPGYLIIRTAWLYGKHGKNFVTTILQLAREQGHLRVVHDQTGSPTYTKDLVRGLLALLDRKATGIFHVTNDGSCTWYEFARTILELAGMSQIPVQPITTQELHLPAPRPKFSALDISKFAKLIGQRPHHWKQGLQEYFEELRIKN